MINKVIIQGHLGNDAEIQTLESGDKMCRFSVAVNDSWRDKLTNEWRNRTNWIPVICFQQGLIDKVLTKNAVKGAHVLIQGELQSNEYTDSNNNNRVSIQVNLGFSGTIEFLPKLPKQQANHQDDAQQTNQQDDASIAEAYAEAKQ